MTTPIDTLSDVDLVAAEKKLGELTGQVRENAAAHPGPGWDAVIDRLEEGWEKLRAEKQRRWPK